MLNMDVLLTLKPKTEVEGSRFILKETIDESNLQFFTVLAKSSKVTMVNVGDTVIADWKRITPPFEAIIDGTKMNVGITAEEEILAVLED